MVYIKGVDIMYQSYKKLEHNRQIWYAIFVQYKHISPKLGSCKIYASKS